MTALETIPRRAEGHFPGIRNPPAPASRHMKIPPGAVGLVERAVERAPYWVGGAPGRREQSKGLGTCAGPGPLIKRR